MSSIEASLLNAAAFAARKHRDQRRKSALKSPYINHPLEVAALLADVGGITDVELLTAALLHDTVEDTETTLAEIEALFGAAVRDLVAEVTDDKSLPKQRRKDLQVENAPHKSDPAKQLKIADKTSNIRDLDAENPSGWDLARKQQYLRWGQAVVEHCRGINPALDQAFDDAVKHAQSKLKI